MEKKQGEILKFTNRNKYSYHLQDFILYQEKITYQKVCFKLFEKASFLRSSHVRPKEKKTFVSALLARQKIILFNDVAGQCNVPCLFTLKLRY